MNELAQLKQEVAELRKMVNQLTEVSSIPYSLQKSLEQRGFLNISGNNKPDLPDPDFTYITNEGFRRDVVLTGEAQTITVPAYPFRFIKLSGNYYIPLHVYSDV